MLRLKKYQLIYIIYFIGLASFLFLNCQGITSQELAAASTILLVFDLSPVFKSKGQFKKIVEAFLLFFILEMFLSHLRYEQSWRSLLYVCIELISLLLYLYFTGAGLSRKERYHWFVLTEKMYKCYLLAMYTQIALSYAGIKLLDSTVYRYRGFTIRVTTGDYLIGIGTLLIVGKLISQGNKGEKSRMADIVTVSLGIVYIIAVSQTRMMILAVILSIGMSYLIAKKNKSKKMITVICGGIALILLCCIPYFQRYFSDNFLGLMSGEDASMIPRLKGIVHYWNYAIQKPILGWGFALETADSNGVYNLYKIFRGEWGRLYTNDVGIFSYVMMYGLAGTILYICLLWKMFTIAIKERYNETYKLAMAIFVLITTFSLIMFDTVRQSYIVLVLMCFEMSINRDIE